MENKTLGGAIAELRKQKGMTQLELADMMGVTDKAVSKWERDISCPDIASLPRLAEILGVTTDELLHAKTGEENKKAPSKQIEIDKIINAALAAVALAQGIYLLVGSAMGIVTADSAMPQIGIGMTCLGLLAVKNVKKR